MSATREINIDTITPLVDNPTSDTMVATDTVATVEVADVSSYQQITESQATGNGNIIAWIGIGLSICVGVFAWKLIDNLKKDIKKLRNFCDASNVSHDKLLMRIDRLNEEIKVLNQKIVNIRQTAPARVIEHNSQDIHTEYERKQQQKTKKVATQIRYATLQSPDENGVLRFSERVMTEVSSPQKMFLLEIDPSNGTGIYRINPSAMGFIVGDLQMFRDFVKPFTFSGNPMNANIQDKKFGKITKQGNFWVVEEPLEISIY